MKYLVLVAVLLSLVFAAHQKMGEKPKIKLFIFTEECYSLFVEQLNFGNVDCWKFVRFLSIKIRLLAR